MKMNFRDLLLSVLIISSLPLILSLNVISTHRGSTVPFKTYEAEDGSLSKDASKDDDSVVKLASSEKSYVHLHGTGEYVEFKKLSAANRLTLRYSLPKNTGGTISLYLNGVHNQDIVLTSAQCYDSQSSRMFRRYDEKSVIINIKEGDNVKVQKDAHDTCEWYGIDLIDLETAPSPLTMPPAFLSITDFGATANDTLDDTEAIKKCITVAASQGKGIWIPAGTFRQNTRIKIPVGMNMMGAGIWYSTLHNTLHGTTYSNDIGFALTSGSTISDIKFTGVAIARALSAHLFRPIHNTETLKNIWVQNIGCVYGWEPGDGEVFDIVLRDSRVIGTYFDGVHWGDGASHNNLVENVFFRGSGDDAVAQVNRVDRPLCYDNVARYNTIISSYWGRGLANIGGDKLTYTDNVISSCALAGVMIATEPLGPSVSRPVKGFLLERNTIHKCGKDGHNHAGIHFWLKTNPMQDVVIRDNIVELGETEGIHIDNTDFGDEGGRVIFENNIVRGNHLAAYNNASDQVKPILKNNTGFSGNEEK